MKRVDHWIGNDRKAPNRGLYITKLDPVTGDPWSEIARGDDVDIDLAVAAAASAQIEWRRTPPSVRAERLWRMSELIAEAADELAELETRDIGKVIREMRGQMIGLPKWWRYAASQCQHLEGQTIPQDRASILNYTLREPYGVIGVIVPFNSPVLLATFSVAPALAVGNTVVIKPSEHASSALVRLAELSALAGLPSGAINVVTGLGGEAGAALVQHRDVAKVVFTGGVEAAKLVADGARLRVKPTVLELGGKSANIVFGDAPVASAVNGIMAGIFAAAGQTCLAGSRLLVHESCAADVADALIERASSIRLGDPMQPETEMGPMAISSFRDNVAARVDSAVADGARVLVGGAHVQPDGLRGWFYAPTVLSEVPADHPVAREELFGPVLTMQTFTDEDEAVAIANDSQFGLAAGVWTKDLGRAHRVAGSLNAGIVWVNTYRSLSYSSPFGGRGLSGHGKELGVEGLLEFTNTKSVWVETSDEPMGDPFVLR